ncbi:MAG: hypothetical protein U1F43_28705 [Myxococcota bacterium]
MNPSATLPRPTLPLVHRAVALGWLALAIALGASGAYAAVRPLVPGLFAVAVASTLLAWRRSPALRAWSDALDLRGPILFHVVRVGFGALFLVELAAGRLPAYFAEKAGIGDIIAGALALVAALAAGRTPLTRVRRAVVLVWCLFGLVDILTVLVTAQYGFLVLGDLQIAATLGRLPYALLPTVVVPLVVLSHLLVLQRLRAA